MEQEGKKRRLIAAVGILQTFAILGVAYLVVVVVGGALPMRSPPAGYRPPGWGSVAYSVQ